MMKKRFAAELVRGHKGVVVAIVPFDHEKEWGKEPVRLAGRRHGWLVRGLMNRAKFDGYIGEQRGRFFMIIDKGLREVAGLSEGDDASFTVEPTAVRDVLTRAVEQSKQTTEPSKARARFGG
jgi:hypothetical protein